MKKTLAIIGVGSAGLQSLCYFCSWLPNDWQITSIHDPNIKSVGIGESTQPSFMTEMQRAIDFNLYKDLDTIKGTIKIGTVFKKWRKHSFINPLWDGAIAIHIDTHRMKNYILPLLVKKWSSKFKVKEQTVKSLDDLDYDFIIDCRGFPTDYSGYTNPPGMLVNHALIHNIKKPGTWNYTGHVATPDGWMFTIPLQERQSYGYMYSDAISSKKEAQANFSKEINVPIKDLDPIEYSFTPYQANEICDGRIFKNGNRAFFFEPLSSNSLFVYNQINRLVLSVLTKGSSIQRTNRDFTRGIQNTKDMIYYYYHGGSTIFSKFWKLAQQGALLQLKKSVEMERVVRDFKYYNAKGVPGYVPPWFYDASHLKQLDKDFGYNYFS